MRYFVLTAIILISSCKQVDSDWINREKHKGLHELNFSNKFETFATEESPENIKRTVKILEQAKEYFDQVFEEDLNFAVLFVDNKNWNTYAFTPPPGMPQSYYDGNIVLGLEKSVIASRAEQGLEKAPDTVKVHLKKIYGEDIDLDLFYRDALSIHELGHLYQFYRTSKNTQRRWINEVFGNLCQVAAVKNFEDQTIFHQMDAYQVFLIEANQWGELKYKTLDEFETNYFDVMKQGRNYGWYQTQFYTTAKELYSKYGDTIVVDFRNFLIKTDVDKIGKLDNIELNNILLEEFGNETIEILKWKYGS
jgi:hypothetical protein